MAQLSIPAVFIYTECALRQSLLAPPKLHAIAGTLLCTHLGMLISEKSGFKGYCATSTGTFSLLWCTVRNYVKRGTNSNVLTCSIP